MSSRDGRRVIGSSMMSTSTTQSLLTNPQVYEMKVRIVDVCTDWIDVYYVLSEQTTVLNSYIIYSNPIL